MALRKHGNTCNDWVCIECSALGYSCRILLNLHNHLMNQVWLLVPFYRWRSWGQRCRNSLFKVTRRWPLTLGRVTPRCFPNYILTLIYHVMSYSCLVCFGKICNWAYYCLSMASTWFRVSVCPNRGAKSLFLSLFKNTFHFRNGENLFLTHTHSHTHTHAHTSPSAVWKQTPSGSISFSMHHS